MARGSIFVGYGRNLFIANQELSNKARNRDHRFLISRKLRQVCGGRLCPGRNLSSIASSLGLLWLIKASGGSKAGARVSAFRFLAWFGPSVLGKTIHKIGCYFSANRANPHPFCFVLWGFVRFCEVLWGLLFPFADAFPLDPPFLGVRVGFLGLVTPFRWVLNRRSLNPPYQIRLTNITFGLTPAGISLFSLIAANTETAFARIERRLARK